MSLFKSLFGPSKGKKEKIEKLDQVKPKNKKILSINDQKKLEIIRELKKISKEKIQKSNKKLTTYQRSLLGIKVYNDIITDFNFQLIDSKKNNFDQDVKIYESPNKYFKIQVVEDKSFEINTPKINGFQFAAKDPHPTYRMSETIFKRDVLKVLEDNFLDWSLDVLDNYNLKLLKTFFKFKQTIEDEKEFFLKSYNKKQDDKKSNLHNKKSSVFKDLDKDGNGIIDIVESVDFMKLFRKHQSIIKEFDKNYINYLVKISNYLKTKRNNIQEIFLEVKKSKSQSQLKEYTGLLKNQIHTYEILLFHSLNLINSIVQEDFVTVNEIYEEFDKLKIFKSDHEKEVSQKLTNIGDGLRELMISINKMENNIVNGLNTLSYVTEEGFLDLNSSLSSELQSINSTLKVGNLISTINTYQNYKINKNTKSLRG